MRMQRRLGRCSLGVVALVLACGGSEGDGSGSAADTGIGSLSNSDTVADETGDKFDVGAGETEGNSGDCPGGGGMPGEPEFSYIWIANSTQGTVSKTVTEGGQDIDNSRLLLAA